MLRKTARAFIGEIRRTYRALRGIDHRALNSSLLAINQSQDIESAIIVAFRYVLQLIDCRWCAFAMYDREYNGGIDIWLSSQIDTLPLTSRIKRDFDITDAYCNIHYADITSSSCLDKGYTETPVNPAFSHAVLGGRTRAYFYCEPARRLKQHQRELLTLLLQALGVAITNYIERKRLENAALIDPLTHCYNRRAFQEVLIQAVASAERYRTDLSLVMLDIDCFKQINDRYGHPSGDAVLKAVSKTIQAVIRKSDYLARYGGEEFMIVLPETRFSKAIELAERLRRILEHVSVQCGSGAISVTASFGVAAFKAGMSAEELLHRTDEMLYEAKRKGRNRVAPDLKLYTTTMPRPVHSTADKGLQ